jgi:broad specificity phosphatase PhoE
VILLRHCESEFNKHEAKKYGEPFTTKDCSVSTKPRRVSSEGICQARTIECDVKPDLILCSPLRRCVETFTHSNVDGPVIFTTLCREHKVDVCDFFEHEDPQDIESEPVLLQRVERFKGYLQRLGESFETILVISHGDFIWYLTSRVMGGQRYGQWLANGETCVLK